MVQLQTRSSRQIWESHHGIYSSLDFEATSPLIRKFFTPSYLVKTLVKLQRDRYLGQDSGLVTLGLHVRDTDKSLEIAPTPLESYLEACDRILTSNRNVAFLAMTDSFPISTAIKEAFGHRVQVLRDLRMSADGRGSHKAIPKVERIGEATRFLASIVLMSKLDHVVTHTGNGAMWTALFRGSTSGLTQFRAGHRH